LGYYGDIADLPAAAQDLLKPYTLPEVTATAQVTPGEAEPPKDSILGRSFTFADGSEEYIDTLEEASSLLRLDELKTMAKEAKVQGKNKRELLKALRRTSQAQGGLGWAGLNRSDTQESSKSDQAGITEDEDQEESNTTEGVNTNRDSHFVRKILTSTGPCIRLSSPTLKLFERVHLVFYRSTEWTEKSLTTIILARISRRNFPEYIVSRSTNIFPSRSALLEFEASIRTQFRIDSILEFNGTVSKDGLEMVRDIFGEVHPRWRILLEEEQRKEDRVYESGEGAYLRRFSPAWVYSRIVHKGTAVLGRFKEHEREHQMLSELLDQQLFHAARRGAWYQRKALLEEHYMWALKPGEGRPEEAQKKQWKRIALQTCEDGLQDRDCHLIYHHDLQKRVMKLEKALKVAKRHQHEFGHVRLSKAVERTVEGIRIEKERPPSRNGNRRNSNFDASRRGAKTVWVDVLEGGGECGVEAMCLSWYRSQGWKGYHSEGGIVRTLFGYLFYDILFTYVPNVFQTPYQTCPLDLHTDAFYPSRSSLIAHRLASISNGSALDILQSVHNQHHEKQTCIVGIDWSFSIDDLQEIVQCFAPEALSTVCKVMAQEYGQRGGGIPDLFLWHPVNREVMFSEVKSENDRLSDTQRLWIHVLTGAGVRVELCNAVAREVVTLGR
jgi:Fanconi-associated nuclease 1